MHTYEIVIRHSKTRVLTEEEKLEMVDTHLYIVAETHEQVFCFVKEEVERDNYNELIAIVQRHPVIKIILERRATCPKCGHIFPEVRKEGEK